MDSKMDLTRRSALCARIGMLMMSLPLTAVSLWGISRPRQWYHQFGGPWARVAELGPYNEHLVVDFNLSQLAFSMLLLGTAFYLTRWLVRISLTIWLVFSLPHFVFHGLHTEAFDLAGNVLLLSTLGLYVLVPVGLLTIIGKSGSAGDPEPGSVRRSDGEPDSFQRIPPASGRSVRVLSWMTGQRFGKPLETIKIAGHHPWYLFGATMGEIAVDQFKALDARLRSLIPLRVAQIVGCPW